MANIQKATQALNYFTRYAGGKCDKMKVLKLIFFADRWHLRRYGRPVVGDRYCAMQWGPVAMTALNAANHSISGDPWALDYVQRYLAPVRDGRGKICWIQSLAEVDLSQFSKSDLEAMEFAWQKFGKYGGQYLSYLTHIYPEWAKHEDVLNSGSRIVDMDYMDFFEDPSPSDLPPDNFVDPFLVDPQHLDIAKDAYLESKRIDELLTI